MRVYCEYAFAAADQISKTYVPIGKKIPFIFYLCKDTYLHAVRLMFLMFSINS